METTIRWGITLIKDYLYIRKNHHVFVDPRFRIIYSPKAMQLFVCSSEPYTDDTGVKGVKFIIRQRYSVKLLREQYGKYLVELPDSLEFCKSGSTEVFNPCYTMLQYVNKQLKNKIFSTIK